MTNEEIHQLAQRIRIDSIRAAAAANSGHPTSSMSAADLMAVLMARHLHYDYDEPSNPNNDHLIFSKGHASPLVYSMYAAAGAITDDELLTFRKFGSRLGGPPDAEGPMDRRRHRLARSGHADRRRDRARRTRPRPPGATGCGRCAATPRWPRARSGRPSSTPAGEGLSNLTVIVDVNRLGQRGETMHGWELLAYSRRAEAGGWKAIEIDGHDIEAIDAAYRGGEHQDRPTMIVARTIKGQGASETANVEGKHGQPLKDPDKAIQELGDVGPVHVDVARPESTASRTCSTPPLRTAARLRGRRRPVPTRKAFGEGLAAVMRRRGDVVALDGEVGNSTHMGGRHRPTRGPLLRGLHRRADDAGRRRWASRSAATRRSRRRSRRSCHAPTTSSGWRSISRAKLCLNGSHAGVSIGEDGPSQMALEDLAEFRALGNSVVLYPSDPNQTVKLGRADGRPRRHLLPALDAPGLPDAVLVRGGASRSAAPSVAARVRRRPGHADRRGRHPARGAQGRRPAQGGRRQRARDRRLLGQADRHRDAPPRPARPPAAGSWSPRTTGPRAASARRCSPRSPTLTSARAWSSSASPTSPGRASGAELAGTTAGSTPTRSSRRPSDWSSRAAGGRARRHALSAAPGASSGAPGAVRVR